jgi:hypothetical protein
VDDEMYRLYRKLAGVQDSEDTPTLRRLVFAPLALAGRGLRSCEEMLERSYLGSQALCAPHLQPLTTTEPAGAARVQAIDAAMQAVKAKLSEERSDELLPAAPTTFTPHFAEQSKERRKEAQQLQQELNTSARLQLEEQLRADAKSTRCKALLQANKARGASLAFTTLPQHRHLAMSNAQTVCNERHRIGLSPEPQLPLHCHCGHANGQYSFDSWHGFSCLMEKGGSITARHDDIKYALAHWVTRLGGRVRVEPRNLERQGVANEHGQQRSRPRRGARREGKHAREERREEGRVQRPGKGKVFDLFIWGLGQPIALDVCVRHLLAPTYVEQSASDPDAVLRAAEADKHRDYDGLADSIGAKFFAFAVTTNGGLGEEALQFIRHIIKEGARFKHVWAPKEVVQGIYRTVAIAIARGNADVISTNLSRSRGADWDS